VAGHTFRCVSRRVTNAIVARKPARLHHARCIKKDEMSKALALSHKDTVHTSTQLYRLTHDHHVLIYLPSPESLVCITDEARIVSSQARSTHAMSIRTMAGPDDISSIPLLYPPKRNPIPARTENAARQQRDAPNVTPHPIPSYFSLTQHQK